MTVKFMDGNKISAEKDFLHLLALVFFSASVNEHKVAHPNTARIYENYCEEIHKALDAIGYFCDSKKD